MAYKCLFLDNEVYTAQDVNDALSNIASSGVSGYPFGNGAMSDLNTAIAGFSNGGVNYHGTSCLVVNDGDTYKISEGACIMNDGTQIIFDSDGYVIEVEAGLAQYVYLERDVLHNTINVVVSQTQGGQDTIPLAEISANGTITDKRKFATAKIAVMAEPQNISITKRITYGNLPRGTYFDADLGFSGWKFLKLKIGNNSYLFQMEDGESICPFYVPNSGTPLGNQVIATRVGSILRVRNNSNMELSDFDFEVEVR